MIAYYLILGTYKKIPIFQSKKVKDILIDNIYFYKKKYNLKLYSFSIIPCHLNLIFSLEKDNLLDFERDYKSHTHNKIMPMILQNKIDYQYICGLGCQCRKYTINNCRAVNKKLGIDQITRETAQILKAKKRFWRRKSGKYKILNLNSLKRVINYSYYNPAKHGIVSKKEIKAYPYTYRY